MGYDGQGRENEELAKADTFSPMKIAKFYSKVKGKPFAIEAMAIGWLANMVRSRRRPNLADEIRALLA